MRQQQPSSLQIENNIQQQKKEWVIQRIAHFVLWGLVIAIAMGLLGRGGLLSTVEKVSKYGTFEIRYDRFLRKHSPDVLRLTTQAQSNSVTIRLERDYLKQIKLEKVTPEPQQVISEGGMVAYIFSTTQKAQVNAAFHFSPEKIGTVQGKVTVDDAPPLQIDQFVYP